jgi:hypothetical protein
MNTEIDDHEDYLGLYSEQCSFCINHTYKYKCKAFPDNIPEDIWLNKVKHSKPLPSQKNDIVFEPIIK